MVGFERFNGLVLPLGAFAFPIMKEIKIILPQATKNQALGQVLICYVVKETSYILNMKIYFTMKVSLEIKIIFL